MSMMSKTTLYLPADLQAGFRALARRLGRPQAALMREALHDYLNQQEPPPLRSMGVLKQYDVQAAESEDWLLANWRPDEDWGRG